jgi:hypothetical protein
LKKLEAAKKRLDSYKIVDKKEGAVGESLRD